MALPEEYFGTKWHKDLRWQSYSHAVGGGRVVFGNRLLFDADRAFGPAKPEVPPHRTVQAHCPVQRVEAIRRENLRRKSFALTSTQPCEKPSTQPSKPRPPKSRTAQPQLPKLGKLRIPTLVAEMDSSSSLSELSSPPSSEDMVDPFSGSAARQPTPDILEVGAFQINYDESTASEMVWRQSFRDADNQDGLGRFNLDRMTNSQTMSNFEMMDMANYALDDEDEGSLADTEDCVDDFTSPVKPKSKDTPEWGPWMEAERDCLVAILEEHLASIGGAWRRVEWNLVTVSFNARMKDTFFRKGDLVAERFKDKSSEYITTKSIPIKKDRGFKPRSLEVCRKIFPHFTLALCKEMIATAKAVDVIEVAENKKHRQPRGRTIPDEEWQATRKKQVTFEEILSATKATKPQKLKLGIFENTPANLANRLPPASEPIQAEMSNDASIDLIDANRSTDPFMGFSEAEIEEFMATTYMGSENNFAGIAPAPVSTNYEYFMPSDFEFQIDAGMNLPDFFNTSQKPAQPQAIPQGSIRLAPSAVNLEDPFNTKEKSAQPPVNAHGGNRPTAPPAIDMALNLSGAQPWMTAFNPTPEQAKLNDSNDDDEYSFDLLDFHRTVKAPYHASLAPFTIESLPPSRSGHSSIGPEIQSRAKRFHSKAIGQSSIQSQPQSFQPSPFPQYPAVPPPRSFEPSPFSQAPTQFQSYGSGQNASGQPPMPLRPPVLKPSSLPLFEPIQYDPNNLNDRKKTPTTLRESFGQLNWD